MLYDEQFIPELNIFYHRNDDININYVDYENVILNKSLSSYIYNNVIMSIFLTFLNKLISLYFDSFNVVKNWRNYNVDKYFYKHSN